MLIRFGAVTHIMTYRQRIVELAGRSVQISREGLAGEPGNFSDGDQAKFLAPLAVLALEGDRGSLETFLQVVRRDAASGLGLTKEFRETRLNDSFCIRSLVEAYHGLIDAGLVTNDVQAEVAPWLYEFALGSADGRVKQWPGFQQWHLRNQNVPATAVYLVAHLLDQTQPGRFDTRPLWDWADRQIVGWDLTWRGPDDSSLYQFIWTWSAYLHAVLRRPDLLSSDNARRSCEFYKTFGVPGLGVSIVFGDASPGDLLAAACSLALGAKLFRDGEMLFLADRYLAETERRGLFRNLVDRGPEFYRLYTIWPDDLEPTPLTGRSSVYVTSPLAGRGWCCSHLEYGIRVKQTDRRYPFFGQHLNGWDAMYQVQDPEEYRIEKPDKFVFASSDDAASLFAVVDHRAHGLHDHADALGVTVLLADGLPWLVESVYLPRTITAERHFHNVPILLPGARTAAELRSWRTDSWRSVEPGDASLVDHGTHVLARARLRHDGFDYVDFDGGFVDFERWFLFVPDDRFVVIDRLVAVREGEISIGQSWHTPARVSMQDRVVNLEYRGKRFAISFAHSQSMQWAEITTHQVPRHDAFYFPEGNPVSDLLWHATTTVAPGQEIWMAAAFARTPLPLELRETEEGMDIQAGDARLSIPREGEARVAWGDA